MFYLENVDWALFCNKEIKVYFYILLGVIQGTIGKIQGRNVSS